MNLVSVLNDVLGPIMRGPSSSHTAGAYRIGQMVRSLLTDNPTKLTLTVDPNGSLAPTLEQLGVDIAFVAGAMGWSMLAEDYTSAIEKAEKLGVRVNFTTARVEHSQHPNAIWIQAESRSGKRLVAGAESIGGGAIRFTHVDGWDMVLTGETHDILVETTEQTVNKVEKTLAKLELLDDLQRAANVSSVVVIAHSTSQLTPELEKQLQSIRGVSRVRCLAPFCHIKGGTELFSDASEMVEVAKKRGQSLGQVALDYESQLLGIPKEAVLEEIRQRLNVMEQSVDFGLKDHQVDMMLLRPTARKIFEAEQKRKVAIGGIHTRAAARAMAAMHACNSRSVVCAAPTGGSAGVIPGVLTSLIEEKGLERDTAALALLAAGAVGAIVAKRATFAAETAGCQVEIGAAGAMAAAAVVEVAGGTAALGTDAAAIALQNTMGSVCDPVHGTCEVPCHTRNAVAASSAFVCADLMLGGYHNPVPLDDSIDASFAVGKSLPRELRCTAAGGLSIAPSALAMERLR